MSSKLKRVGGLAFVFGVGVFIMDKHKKYYRTKKGVINHMFKSQKNRPYGLTYTKDQFKEWVLQQNNFHKYYNDWVESDFDKWKKPSVDRIDDYLPYSFGNIQVLTWRENFEKYLSNPVKTLKPIIKYNLNFKKIRTLNPIFFIQVFLMLTYSHG